MNRATIQADLRAELHAHFGIADADVRFVFAPYRICPLGAHIDHQLGVVTAMAIDHGVWLAYAPSAGKEVRLRSRNFPGEVKFDVAAPGFAQPGDWGNYARGAAVALRQAGYSLDRGLCGIIAGPWSEGGLSSSAAVGVAYLLALEDVNGLGITAAENIRLDQAIENGFLGLRNGILDQSGILLSRRHQLTVIDCATAQHELIPGAADTPDWRLLLAFSGLQKTLASTDYNRRVGECAEAAQLLLAAAGRAETEPRLGHVNAAEYEQFKARLPAPLDRRARHYFSETERVQQGIAAWRNGDLVRFGKLMTASGESSIVNYECGAPPLIDLYQIMIQCPGVYGARFSGAGFRGCCVGLVDAARAAEAAREIQAAYSTRHPELAVNATVAIAESGDGARVMR